jgi:hypothetical protein
MNAVPEANFGSGCGNPTALEKINNVMQDISPTFNSKIG